MSDDQPDKEGRVLRIFEDARRFTEDLLRENEKLRLLVSRLKSERQDLEQSYVRVDVPRLQEKTRVLEDELRQLKEQNRELREQFESVEDENREFADRYVSVEQQYSDLIQLYVATCRLHSTLDPNEVLTIIKEIVINMVGAEVFGVYLVAESQRELELVAHEGLDGSPARIPLGEGVVGQAAVSGEVWVNDGGAEPGYLACIPMVVRERTLGVIAISKLLSQKDGLKSLDFGLFELLGGHAATAVYGATLYSMSERKRTTLEGFMELLRGTKTEPAR